MMWTYLFMGIILFIIGFAVHILKWNMLIAGYNTMPKENKKKVDTKALGRLLGFYGYISGAFFLLMALLEYLGWSISPTVITAVFVVWTMIILFIAQKYDGNTKWGKKNSDDEKNND